MAKHAHVLNVKLNELQQNVHTLNLVYILCISVNLGQCMGVFYFLTYFCVDSTKKNFKTLFRALEN